MLLLCGSPSAANHGVATSEIKHEVAITIDDIPRSCDGGRASLEEIQSMTVRLLAPFKRQGIPLTGFVNVGRTRLAHDELPRIFNLWLDAGAELGNHTFSHSDLNSIPAAEYERDITNGEGVLRDSVEAHGKKLQFFRYPMLHAGSTADTKNEAEQFLAAHGYRNAPVTFDNSDYLFAAAFIDPQLTPRVRREYIPYLESVVAFFEQRGVEVVGREFPQIMLLHASELNSQMMPAILEMFRRRGYRFVTLDDALRDGAYRLPENYVGRRGLSWIHRWSTAKGLSPKNEPDAPEWVRKAFTGRHRTCP